MQDNFNKVRRKKISSSKNKQTMDRLQDNRGQKIMRNDNNRGMVSYNEEKGYSKVSMSSNDKIVNKRKAIDNKFISTKHSNLEGRYNERSPMREDKSFSRVKPKSYKKRHRREDEKTPIFTEKARLKYSKFIKNLLSIILLFSITLSMAGFGYYKYCTYDMEVISKEKIRASYINDNPVDINKVPEDLKNAFIAIEDERFYDHNGVDLKSLMRSFVSTVFLGEMQGGSTIDMQVSKILLTTSDKTMKRKMMDIRNAWAMNRVMTKDEILEAYINNVYFGKSTYGVADGAKLFFNTDVSKLNLSQSTILAGITNNPRRFSEYNEARIRQRLILNKMYELGYIDKSQEKDAIFRDVPFKSEIE